MLSKKDEAFFGAAREMSHLSDYNQHKIGCVIVHKNRILSSGVNSQKTSPLQKRYNRFRYEGDSTPHKLHAETAALTPLLRDKNADLSKVKVYLYREHANGDIAMSRPCKACMALLKDAGIKEIHYTTEDGYAKEFII